MKKFLFTSKHLAVSLLFTLPLYSPIAHSSPSTTGEGNLVTGTNGVATGYNNTVTATNGLAQGNNSVATGDNKSREEFEKTVEDNKQAIADKTAAENALSKVKTSIEVNEKTQNDLNNKINELTDLINRTGNKTNQINSLNTELSNKKNELAELNKALEEAKRNATSTSGTGDKTIWINFKDQLAKLNWSKIKKNNDGTLDYSEVAKELKSKIETDYPDLIKWDINKYEEIIYGYKNGFTAYENNKNRIIEELKKDANKYIEQSLFDDYAYFFIKKLTNDSEFFAPKIQSIPSIKTDDFMPSIHAEVGEEHGDHNDPYFTALEIHKDSNILSNITKNYYNRGYYTSNSNSVGQIFYLPPIKEGEYVNTGNTSNQYSFYYYVSKIFSLNNNSTFNKINVDNLNNILSNFFDFYKKIDRNAPEDKWLFNKEKFIAQIDKVAGFAEKLKAFVTSYNELSASPQDSNKEIEVIKHYTEIVREKDDIKNYYGSIEFDFKPEVIELWNKYADKATEKLRELSKKLKLYDEKNEIIQGINSKAEELKQALNKAKNDVNNKQKEIDNITKQIDNLALTEDEKNATKLKEKKEKELADKQAEKAELEKDKVKKEEALKALEEELKKTNLANIGKNAIASGTNAFASGENAIAIGTNNEVTGNNSVAIGSNNKVYSDNVMVLGNNVEVPKEGQYNDAVVLGNNSAPSEAHPTSTYTDGTHTYTFAGTTPTSTVSVGDKGKERQITNVAAGRISNTSTDAINGSQLYSVIAILKKLQANTPNPTGNTTGDTTGGTTGSTTGGTTGGSTGGSGTVPSIGNVNISGDNKNISVTGGTGNFTVKLNDDISLNKVKTGDVSFSNNGINAGNKIVSNVANGKVTETSTDAINGSQLYSVKQESAATNQRIDALTQKVNKDNKMLKAGIAGTAAIAGLPQVRGNGKAMVSAGAGNFKGQNAIAVGYSRSSDNGKVLFRLSGSANTQGDVVSSVGVGYEW